MLINDRRTRITTVNSMRVIPDFTVFWVFVSVMVLSVLVDDAHRARAFSTWIYRSDFIFIVPIHPGAFKSLLVDSTALQ